MNRFINYLDDRGDVPYTVIWTIAGILLILVLIVWLVRTL